MHLFQVLTLDGAGKTHVMGISANSIPAARALARLGTQIKPAVVLTVISEHLL